MSKQSRRDFSRTLAGGIGAAALSQASGSPGRPNVLFVCSDQHTFRYTGYAGHPLVKTPNLDRIAARGVVFENAYCQSPVCGPSRASLMTGVYASDVNSFCNSTMWDGSHPTWGTHLRRAGYHTEATGKVELNDDFDTGFKEVHARHPHRHGPDITTLFRRPPAYRVLGGRDVVQGRTRSRPHGDKATTQTALDFIRNRGRTLAQPWAYYVGLQLPHPPFLALPKYAELYPPEKIALPQATPAYFSREHQVMRELRNHFNLPEAVAREQVLGARGAYYGMISELDEYVGRLYDAVNEAGLLQQTLFVYASDHGESLGEHGLWHKCSLYENSAHVPLVMCGGGLPEGKVVSGVVGLVDVIATMIDLAGVPRDSDLRGYSLRSLVHGGGGHPGFAYAENHTQGNLTGSFLIRKGPWKYIHFTWFDDLLFNLDQDPYELHNRIREPGVREVLAELKRLLRTQVDPEEVTRRAFAVQEKFLKGLSRNRSEDQLAKMFERRMGKGLARILASKVKAGEG